MFEKRLNRLMIVMSLIGGVLGFILGEILLKAYEYSMPHTILMGLYFGIIALFVGTMCIIAEIISPKLNGYTWKNNYLGASFKFLIPCTFIALFIVGCLFQFIYELNIGDSRKINDIMLLMDTSESMKTNDPNNERFEAAQNLLDSMNEDNRFSIYTFADNAQKILPMTAASEENKKTAVKKLNTVQEAAGETNTKDALDKAFAEIEKSHEDDRHAIIILLSDGEDSFDLQQSFEETVKPFKDKKISIYTVGMTIDSNFELLKNISRETGGNYYNVTDLKNLKDVFNKIYKFRERRLLVDKRYGLSEYSMVYSIMRIVFLMFIGIAIAAAVCFIFDNKYLLKTFIVGGFLGGLLAGLILEFGFKILPWKGSIYRFAADVILAVMFTVFSVSIEVKEESHGFFRGSGSSSRDESDKLFSKSSKEGNSF